MPGGVNPPMEVVLAWPKSNYKDPVTRGNAVVIIEVVLLILCYIIVALRVYTRAVQARNFGVDDALIVFNMIPLTGLAVCIILAFTNYGWDRHIWDIPPDMLVASRKTAMSIEITYLVSTCATKVSILLFYRRLSGAVSPRFRYCVYAAIAFVVGYCLAYFIMAFCHCRPLNAYWNQGNAYWRMAHTDDWKCTDEAAQIVAACAISMIQDFIACLLPMALFARLRISRKQKLALAGIFGVGFFLCICAVLRLIKTIEVYYHTYDITWHSYEVWIWTGVEAHMAVVCASLPAMNHFMKNVLKDTQIGSSMRSWSNKYSRGSSTSRSRSKGYMQTTSQTDSELPYTARTHADGRKGIHVVQEVKLEEFLTEKRPNFNHKEEDRGRKPRVQDSSFIDDASRTPHNAAGTWLEDDTSSGDDRPFHHSSTRPTRKYSGHADTRRFY